MGLEWTKKILDELRVWSEKCYPYEGCGLLVGEFQDKNCRIVKKFVSLDNTLQNHKDSIKMGAVAENLKNRFEKSKGEFEFVINPEEFNAVVLESAKEGLDVVGVLHTHPDHPAKPSATDAAQPLLAGWSNVIIKVSQGRYTEARSWFRAEEKDPFEEEKIIVK